MRISTLSLFIVFISSILLITNAVAQHAPDHDATAEHAADTHGEDHDSHGESGEVNIGEVIMHHISDAHSWHIVGDFTIYLPVILFEPGEGFHVFSSRHFYSHHHPTETHEGFRINENEKIIPLDESRKVYDFSITKNVASLFLSIILTLVVFLSVANGYNKRGIGAPRGIQSLFEPIIIFVRDEIVKPAIGEHKYERFLPYLLTLFFFIWFNNLLGLTPGAANLTGNIAVTACLALITFVITNVNGNKDYWKHVFWTPGVPWWMKVPFPMVPLVEFIGLFTKPFALMIRLFVSITAGHIVILSLIGLAFIFQSVAAGFVGTVFVTFINIIELLVATIQAYVFTLFSSMYIGAAVEEHHHAEEVADKSLI